MSYGLSIENPGGKLVISSDGVTLSYLGRATHVSTQQPYDANGSTYIDSAGFVTMTFTHGAAIVPAIRLTANRDVGILSVTNSGSTWTIVAYCGAPPLVGGGAGFQTQYIPDVYVFGIPTSTGPWGAALYNAAGVLCADLTRQPLAVKAKLSFAQADGFKAFSGITTPAVIGSPRDFYRQRIGPGPTFYEFRFLGSTLRLGTGRVDRVAVQTELLLNEEGIGPNLTTQRAFEALLIDVNGLP